MENNIQKDIRQLYLCSGYAMKSNYLREIKPTCMPKGSNNM